MCTLSRAPTRGRRWRCARRQTHTRTHSRATGLCWELAGAVGVLHGRAFARCTFARCSGLAWHGVAWLSACVRARGGLRGRGSHVSVRPDVRKSKQPTIPIADRDCALVRCGPQGVSAHTVSVHLSVGVQPLCRRSDSVAVPPRAVSEGTRSARRQCCAAHAAWHGRRANMRVGARRPVVARRATSESWLAKPTHEDAAYKHAKATRTGMQMSTRRRSCAS
jgi:hypothetical protein